MTREERIRAAIAGRETDRVPVAAWMHLSEHDQDPISLAEAEVELTCLLYTSPSPRDA